MQQTLFLIMIGCLFLCTKPWYFDVIGDLEIATVLAAKAGIFVRMRSICAVSIKIAVTNSEVQSNGPAENLHSWTGTGKAGTDPRMRKRYCCE